MDSTIKIGILTFILAGILIMLGFTLAFIYLFLSFKKRIEREQAALRDAEITFERQLNEASVKAEQQERVQIAMDLHDEIGTLITVLKINMHNAKVRLDQPERLNKVIDETSDIIEKTADVIRNISNRISPPTLTKLGLEVALVELVAAVNATGKMVIVYKSNLETKRFRLDAELNIYRIIKEMFNNILKHSHTDKLFVQLQVDEREFRMNFEYEGIGLNEDQVKLLLRVAKGNGLRSIQSRINNLRAQIFYEIHKFGQAEIRIKIPLNEIEN